MSTMKTYLPFLTWAGARCGSRTKSAAHRGLFRVLVGLLMLWLGMGVSVYGQPVSNLVITAAARRAAELDCHGRGFYRGAI